MAMTNKEQARLRRHSRVRKRVRGTAARPRLNVFRSSEHIYVQLIDDDAGSTLVSASTVEAALRGQMSALKKLDAAKAVGQAVAQRALEKGIKQVVFDRGGYQYHGRIKALADASREAGLEF